MSEISERYRRIAGQFTERANAVPAGAWDKPAPCEGWVARDVVRHMVEWVPAFFASNAGVEFPKVPSVDDDPVAAWTVLSDAIQAALDDPEVARREFEVRGERHTVEDAFVTFCIGDVLVHTWDLARATGADEALDADEVHRLLERTEPIADTLSESGHFGERVAVPDDADEQTRLLALTGRDPFRR
jgi:uncharacterized protein (TIGR03086 family)